MPVCNGRWCDSNCPRELGTSILAIIICIALISLPASYLKVYQPEIACEQSIVSGGGFSDVFTLPDWQRSAVTAYLSNYTPPYSADVYNTSGSRGFPDISLNG